MWHGSEKRPTMYIASMDTKTASDMARPKRTARIMGAQDVHGWMTVALIREMTGWMTPRDFRKCRKQVPFDALHPPGER